MVAKKNKPVIAKLRYLLTTGSLLEEQEKTFKNNCKVCFVA